MLSTGSLKQNPTYMRAQLDRPPGPCSRKLPQSPVLFRGVSFAARGAWPHDHVHVGSVLEASLGLTSRHALCTVLTHIASRFPAPDPQTHAADRKHGVHHYYKIIKTPTCILLGSIGRTETVNPTRACHSSKQAANRIFDLSQM